LTDESGFGLGVAVFFIIHSAAPRPRRGSPEDTTLDDAAYQLRRTGLESYLIIFLSNYHPASLPSVATTVTRLSVPLRRMDASLLSRMDTTLA
jgi:hypothetical protein